MGISTSKIHTLQHTVFKVVTFIKITMMYVMYTKQYESNTYWVYIIPTATIFKLESP